MDSNDTIVALSSGKGKCALSIIRLSGEASISIFKKCCTKPENVDSLPSQTIRLFTFVNPYTNKIIDHLTAIIYKKPYSFTGENMVELFCHGSDLIVEKIISAVMDYGVHLASPGEFSKRAYLNGKMDLLKAEAIHDIIGSKTNRALDASVNAYFGGYKTELVKWKNELAIILRNIEAFIEFPEENDIQKESLLVTIRKIDLLKTEIHQDLEKRKKAQIIESGINVPIVGTANVGKSSLFNLLLGYERAIVHSEEGTTRDSISEEIIFGEEKVRLIDTAGLRDTEEVVEKKGIEQTSEYIKNSSLIIWVTAANSDIKKHEQIFLEAEIKRRIICLISKKDLNDNPKQVEICKKMGIPYLVISLSSSAQKNVIIDFISEQIRCMIGTIEFPRVIRNKRQENIAKDVVNNLLMSLNEHQEETIAYYLQKALKSLGDVAGEVSSDEIIDSIFSEFCIGK